MDGCEFIAAVSTQLIFQDGNCAKILPHFLLKVKVKKKESVFKAAHSVLQMSKDKK